MTGQKKTSDDLAHYGVKGMRWGVRRAEANPDYSQENRSADKKQFGRSGVRKINKRLNKGESYQKARKSVMRNRAMRNLAIAGALYAAPQILEIAEKTSGSIAQRAQTKRGEAAVADLMGLPRKASNGPAYSEPKRGVYKISSI